MIKKTLIVICGIFMNTLQANYSCIYELSQSRREELHQLYQQAWWANTRTRQDVDVIVDNSLPIGFIDDSTGALVGFVRIISDRFKYAFIFDVILQEEYRGKGLGKVLMESALNHPALKKVTVFELHCRPELAAFYEKFGFKEDFEGLKALRLKRVAA